MEGGKDQVLFRYTSRFHNEIARCVTQADAAAHLLHLLVASIYPSIPSYFSPIDHSPVGFTPAFPIGAFSVFPQ